MQGIASEVQSRFSSEPVDDVKLVERVRAKLGRIVSHPSAIKVTSQNGRVVLSGPILTPEVPQLLADANVRATGLNSSRRTGRRRRVLLPARREHRSQFTVGQGAMLWEQDLAPQDFFY